MAENEESDEIVESGTPAILIRKVDVIIQDGENSEPRIIKALPEDQPQQEKPEE